MMDTNTILERARDYIAKESDPSFKAEVEALCQRFPIYPGL